MLARLFTLCLLFAGVFANIVYSGFSTQCQTCLDGAVNNCNTGSQFTPCVCDGTGMDKAMECVSTCSSENPTQAARLITVFSGYCCLKYPSINACVQILKAQGNSTATSISSLMTASPTASTSRLSTGATLSSTGTASRSATSAAGAVATSSSSAGAAPTGDAKLQNYGLSAMLGLAVVAAQVL